MVKLIKELRNMTGCSLKDCKDALTVHPDDLEKAKQYLRAKGQKFLNSGRTTGEGLIATYLHHNNRVAVLVELGTETDFAAKNAVVKNLGREIAMHVASANPRWLSHDVPNEFLDAEEKLLEKRAEGKPPKVRERIMKSGFETFRKQNCLLYQPWVKNPKIRIDELIAETCAKVGEMIELKRFVRYEVGNG